MLALIARDYMVVPILGTTLQRCERRSVFVGLLRNLRLRECANGVTYRGVFVQRLQRGLAGSESAERTEDGMTGWKGPSFVSEVAAKAQAPGTIIDIRVKADNRYGYRWLQPVEIKVIVDALAGDASPSVPPHSSHEFKNAIMCVTCNAVYFDQRWHQLEEHFRGECIKPELCEGVLHHTISRGDNKPAAPPAEEKKP